MYLHIVGRPVRLLHPDPSESPVKHRSSNVTVDRVAESQLPPAQEQPPRAEEHRAPQQRGIQQRRHLRRIQETVRVGASPDAGHAIQPLRKPRAAAGTIFSAVVIFPPVT